MARYELRRLQRQQGSLVSGLLLKAPIRINAVCLGVQTSMGAPSQVALAASFWRKQKCGRRGMQRVVVGWEFELLVQARPRMASGGAFGSSSGVIGAGKTEVQLELTRSVLTQGQALWLERLGQWLEETLAVLRNLALPLVCGGLDGLVQTQ